MTRTTANETGAQPRYRQVAEELLEDIRKGRLKVGDTLPGELELQGTFGVSRHTVREALRVLGDLGLIDRQQGIGTVLKSRRSKQSYVQSVRSPAELLQYPDEARLQVVHHEPVRTSRKLARLLGCPVGAQWVHIGAVRRLKGTRVAICWLDLYVVPEYASVVGSIGRRQQLVCEMIEERFGEKVQSVGVEIRASAMPASVAARLDVAAGTPSLKVVRRYVGNDRRLFQVGISEHPADRYAYSLELKRGWQGDDSGWSAV